MTDTDSYLLKCTLESIGKGVPAREIQKRCECQMGLVDCYSDDSEAVDKPINQSEKGEK